MLNSSAATVPSNCASSSGRAGLRPSLGPTLGGADQHCGSLVEAALDEEGRHRIDPDQYRPLVAAPLVDLERLKRGRCCPIHVAALTLELTDVAKRTTHDGHVPGVAAKLDLPVHLLVRLIQVAGDWPAATASTR